MLNETIRANEQPDYDGTGTWPRRTEGVEVSTNGTVTVKPRSQNKPAIPDTFVDHREVNRNTQADAPYFCSV